MCLTSNYNFGNLIEEISYDSFQEVMKENKRVPKCSLLDLSKKINTPYKNLKVLYDAGLVLLVSIIQAFDLFDRKQGIKICPDCGKILKSKETCTHEKDFYSQFDDDLDDLEYLGFLSYERYIILCTFAPELLQVLKSKGYKKPLQKKIC